jgi:hypothetical protein
MEGVVHVVDHRTVDLGNLQRYVMAERSDETNNKVVVLARYFVGGIQAKRHAIKLEDFVATQGYTWPRMILALDSARDRRAAQASLPQWIANAWTQPGDLGVSRHNFLDGACVACLYLPDHVVENEDAIVASALGIPNYLIQIRTLLHNGEGVSRNLLDAIATAREIPIERLLPFEAVLQLAVQFAYDFVLHAACPPLQWALVLGIMHTGGAQRYTAGGSIMVPKM